MRFATTLPAAILETILGRLAALFLTGAAGDMNAARQAALHMLRGYDPQTEDEFRLAANIIAFSFQALEALAQAATPDMSLTRILRLRGGAVTLNRESQKAERRLKELQQARQQAAEPANPEPTKPEPRQAESAAAKPTTTDAAKAEAKIEKTLNLIAETREIAAVADTGGLTWSKAEAQRQQDLRIAANTKKAEALAAANTATGTPTHQTAAAR